MNSRSIVKHWQCSTKTRNDHLNVLHQWQKKERRTTLELVSQKTRDLDISLAEVSCESLETTAIYELNTEKAHCWWKFVKTSGPSEQYSRQRDMTTWRSRIDPGRGQWSRAQERKKIQGDWTTIVQRLHSVVKLVVTFSVDDESSALDKVTKVKLASDERRNLRAVVVGLDPRGCVWGATLSRWGPVTREAFRGLIQLELGPCRGSALHDGYVVTE